jgi:hypothetical protein
MSVVNEEVFARSAETSGEVECDTGCDRDARRESGYIGNQQERVSRAHGSRPCFIGDRSPVTGGILRQLIDEYTNQLAYENEQKKQIEEKIERIGSRIQEFNILLEELKSNKKT